jgi:hypothetical protein
MDELTLVRDLRPDEPLPGDMALQPARAALLQAMAVEAAAGKPRTGSRAEIAATGRTARSTTRRPRRRVLGGLAVAAALAAVATVGPWHGMTGGGSSAVADPVTVLDEAARYAASQPFQVPRADQFLYLAPARWASVDGTHDGFYYDSAGRRIIEPGCRNGRRLVLGGQVQLQASTEACVPDPAYLADAPTTAQDMLDYLHRRVGGPENPNALAKSALDMLGQHYLRPAAASALFLALTQVPGLHAVADVVDVAGKHGIGLSWSTDGSSATLVFDASTHAYLGINTVGLRGEKGYGLRPPMAIVDRAGQLPGQHG